MWTWRRGRESSSRGRGAESLSSGPESLSSGAECLMCFSPQKGPVPVGLALQAQRAHGEYLPRNVPACARSGTHSAARGAHGAKENEI